METAKCPFCNFILYYDVNSNIVTCEHCKTTCTRLIIENANENLANEYNLSKSDELGIVKDKEISDKRMYILVNEDIKIGKAKLSGQVGHAVATYIYRNFIRDYSNNLVQLTNDKLEFLDDYMKMQKKIILSCPQDKLIELEKENKYIVIRDKGLTQLEPNTLTCICMGILDKASNDFPSWINELKLYSK